MCTRIESNVCVYAVRIFYKMEMTTATHTYISKHLKRTIDKCVLPTKSEMIRFSCRRTCNINISIRQWFCHFIWTYMYINHVHIIQFISYRLRLGLRLMHFCVKLDLIITIQLLNESHTTHQFLLYSIFRQTIECFVLVQFVCCLLSAIFAVYFTTGLEMLFFPLI